jgi:hypothetical protein
MHLSLTSWPRWAWPLVTALLVALTLSGSGFRTALHAPGRSAGHPSIQVASAPVHGWIPRGVLSPAPLGQPQASRQADAWSQGTTQPKTYVQFNGMGQDNWNRPDSNAAASPNDLVELVNAQIAAYTKTGQNLFQLSLQQWDHVPSQARIFDPHVTYDMQNGHYIVIDLRTDGPSSSFVDLSVSVTSSAQGNWCKYSFSVQDGSNQPDYPGLGFDGQAVYVTMNMLSVFNGSFQYAKLLIINKAQLYQCASPVSVTTIRDLKNPDGSLAYAVIPARTFDSEPAEYLVNSALMFGIGDGPSAGGQSQTSANSITLWTLTNPLINPTLTNTAITVQTYTLPPYARQKGSNALISTGGPMMQQAVVYSGDLWTAHTTGFGLNNQYAAAQWFEFNAAQQTLVQQQIYGLNGYYVFMPAITVIPNGSAFMVFDASSSTSYVGVYDTARQAADPPNQMGPYALLQAGLGPFATSGQLNWGDFFSAAIDPSDMTKVWVCAEYPATGDHWATTIGEIGF